MGIDGIGKRGGIPGASAPPAASGAAKTGKTFELDVPQAPNRAETAASVSAASAHREVQAGRLDVEVYLDRKVEQATSHLEGMPSDDLASIRSMLREQLRSDPAFVELIQQATGQLPPPTDD